MQEGPLPNDTSEQGDMQCSALVQQCVDECATSRDVSGLPDRTELRPPLPQVVPFASPLHRAQLPDRRTCGQVMLSSPTAALQMGTDGHMLSLSSVLARRTGHPVAP